ncbi:MAG: 4'-phosphopantetheinyl transferase superfamily protein [Aestuariivirga sp.]
MPLIRIATFTQSTRSATLAELIAAHGLVGFEPQKAESGKPYLRAADGRMAGLAICHVRKTIAHFQIMAVSDEAAIGLDAEVWPKIASDEAFLRSIAAPEDAPFIARVRKASRDPATLLWVLKEAAVKASGEVMTDPRHITVSLSPNGYVEASTSTAATAPLPRIKLRVFELSTKTTERGVVLAVGIAALPGPENGPNLNIVCARADIQLHEFNW